MHSFLLPNGPQNLGPGSALAGWQEGGWDEYTFPVNPRCQRQPLPPLPPRRSIGAAAVAEAAYVVYAYLFKI